MQLRGGRHLAAYVWYLPRGLYGTHPVPLLISPCGFSMKWSMSFWVPWGLLVSHWAWGTLGDPDTPDTLMADIIKQLSGGMTQPHSFSFIMLKSWERYLCQAMYVFSIDCRNLSLPAWKLFFITHCWVWTREGNSGHAHGLRQIAAQKNTLFCQKVSSVAFSTWQKSSCWAVNFSCGLR